MAWIYKRNKQEEMRKKHIGQFIVLINKLRFSNLQRLTLSRCQFHVRRLEINISWDTPKTQLREIICLPVKNSFGVSIFNIYISSFL